MATTTTKSIVLFYKMIHKILQFLTQITTQLKSRSSWLSFLELAHGCSLFTTGQRDVTPTRVGMYQLSLTGLWSANWLVCVFMRPDTFVGRIYCWEGPFLLLFRDMLKKSKVFICILTLQIFQVSKVWREDTARFLKNLTLKEWLNNMLDIFYDNCMIRYIMGYTDLLSWPGNLVKSRFWREIA